MKVILFSRFFPAYHPKDGQETFFVEKILNELYPGRGGDRMEKVTPAIAPLVNDFFILDGDYKKYHTIRAGSRWKDGDMASLRVWSDKPYRSKQIEFARVEIKRVWSVELSFWPLSDNTQQVMIKVDGRYLGNHNTLASNDGLSHSDFLSWFPKPMVGQIICWSSENLYP